MNAQDLERCTLASELIQPAEKTVRHVGERLRDYRGPLPHDTEFARGHEANEIDIFARNEIAGQMTRNFSRYDGVYFTEDHPQETKYMPTNEYGQDEATRRSLLFVVDECEGTTNQKRRLHSPIDLGDHPDVGVSLAISGSTDLRDLLIGAFYDLRSGKVLSAMRYPSPNGEPNFLSMVEGRRLNKEDFHDKRGDSAYRIIVAGYSNNRREDIGKLSAKLHDSGFRVYGGCRASGVDLVSLLKNQYDAYVDMRAYLSRRKDGREMNAQLQVYDVCGMLPVVVGCGLKATDPFGEPYYSYDFKGKIPLIVSRPAIHDKILDLVRPFAEHWKKSEERV